MERFICTLPVQIKLWCNLMNVQEIDALRRLRNLPELKRYKIYTGIFQGELVWTENHILCIGKVPAQYQESADRRNRELVLEEREDLDKMLSVLIDSPSKKLQPLGTMIAERDFSADISSADRIVIFAAQDGELVITNARFCAHFYRKWTKLEWKLRTHSSLPCIEITSEGHFVGLIMLFLPSPDLKKAIMLKWNLTSI